MLAIFKGFRILDLIDIFAVSLLVYYVLLWFKGSRGFQLLKGVLFLLSLYTFSKSVGLHTIEWLLQKLVAILFILLVVVFQPELRRGLERIGRHFFISTLFFRRKNQEVPAINKIVRATQKLSSLKIGALIIIERNTGLGEYVESGIQLDALLSTELLISLFQKKSPLHDGAVVIQGDRISAASCLLPLMERRVTERKLGTRHRAAIGLSEVTDALVIIVSEETGSVSLAENGELFSNLSREALKDHLIKRIVKEEKKLK